MTWSFNQEGGRSRDTRSESAGVDATADVDMEAVGTYNVDRTPTIPDVPTTTVLLAHQGGWDEILLVAVPIVAIVAVLAVAKRRVDRIDDGPGDG